MFIFLFQWLSQTIFVRLSREIRNINKALARIGSDDMKIGGNGYIYICIALNKWSFSMKT